MTCASYEFESIWGVAVDAQGSRYLADKDKTKIINLDASENYLL